MGIYIGAVFVIALIAGLVVPIFSRISEDTVMLLRVVFAILAIPVAVFVVWMVLALGVKRWHDRGKSGWWMLIHLIPYLGGLWAFIECGCLRGTEGANDYGEDPT